MTNSVAIVMGSKSDMALAEATKEVLDGYGIGSVIKVLSAHRTPEALKAVSYTHLTLPTSDLV